MYNSMSIMPKIPYNIVTELINNPDAEDLWKMLKYNDYNALSNENLTKSEKMKFIWKEGAQQDYSIFFTNLVEDVIAESRCIMKCYNYYIHANELYSGVVVYCFDFLYGGRMSLVEKDNAPVSRGDLFINTILKCLNGKYVGGVGKLTFYDDMSRYDLARSIVGNSKTFTGIQLFLSVIVGDSGRADECDS